MIAHIYRKVYYITRVSFNSVTIINSLPGVTIN